MRPHVIRAFLLLLTATALARSPLAAKTPPTESTPDIELDRLVIQDSPPGSIPFSIFGQYNLFTGSMSYPPVIPFVGPKDEKLSLTYLDARGRQKQLTMTWYVQAPDLLALKNGGQILAIDGIDVAGIHHHLLTKLFLEGKAGEPVTLVIRGCGDEMHLFREITVKRISERKGKRLLDEAASRELRPARSLAELPATPDSSPSALP